MKDPEEDRKYILGYLPENNQISYVFGAGYLHSFTGGVCKLRPAAITSKINFTSMRIMTKLCLKRSISTAGKEITGSGRL